MEELSDFNKKLQKAMGVKSSRLPRMSVNKLGEFMVATPRRQRSILEALKYPSENKFRFTGYNDAKDAIKKYILNDFNEEILLDCISDLEALNEEERDNFTDSSILALTTVLESNELPDSGFTFLPYEGNNPKLEIEGIEVSVYPDFIVNSETIRAEYYGAAKIHLSKAGHFGNEGGKYISTVIHQFSEHHIQKNGRILRNTNCISYDVFSDSVVDCPKSVVRRWQDIEAGCKNIAAIWDSI